MTQSWHDLLFAHWRVDATGLRRAIPANFELDLFNDEAWLGVVPFHMTNVGFRATPLLPWLSAFPEINVRTYVRAADRPGVYFFSLDAARRPAVAAARALLNLPYFTADMRFEWRDGKMHYASTRRTRQDARFRAAYEPSGIPFTAVPGTLEYFLTERYCVYHCNRHGDPSRLDIHHRPWALQDAGASITLNTMAAVHGLVPKEGSVLLHFARRQDVVAWAPTRVVQSE